MEYVLQQPQCSECFANVKIKPIRSLEISQCQNVPSTLRADNCELLCSINSNANIIGSFYTAECIIANVRRASVIGLCCCL